jgi:2-dehydro-3-deoxyphosphooctonate aldolase (KDO 8-P synthase)
MNPARTVTIGNVSLGGGLAVTLIAGPCVVESRDIVMHTAETLKKICARLSMPLIFKSSYRKANRTSESSFTGIGDEAALAILAEVKQEFGLPILTDVHKESEASFAAEVADVLQIPAFLSRQTDLLFAAGETGKAVNIKKGQFLAPEDMKHAADKVASTGNNNILLCERGTSFGYHNLVVDMRGLAIMREFGYPVVMDATHAVQIPSKGRESGGTPQFIFPLARAATAVGIDALFIETHPDPSSAKSDAGSQLDLVLVEPLIKQIKAIDSVVKEQAVHS